MSLDLNELLRDWPHEPGQLKVRKITGSDGREKLQLRIDLGLIQMEPSGRPDGHSPHGCESMYDYHLQRARQAEKNSATFTLTAEEIAELSQEGIQYYHRYISFFQIGEYDLVVRDTRRNLEMFAFVEKHAASEDLAHEVTRFTPYLLMMNTRAHASIELERADHQAAASQVEKGIERIREFHEEHSGTDAIQNSAEIGFLTDWMEEIRPKQQLFKVDWVHK